MKVVSGYAAFKQNNRLLDKLNSLPRCSTTSGSLFLRIFSGSTCLLFERFFLNSTIRFQILPYRSSRKLSHMASWLNLICDNRTRYFSTRSCSGLAIFLGVIVKTIKRFRLSKKKRYMFPKIKYITNTRLYEYATLTEISTTNTYLQPILEQIQLEPLRFFFF